MAFSLVIFWGLPGDLDALLDHALQIARTKQMGVAASMPWIEKTHLAFMRAVEERGLSFALPTRTVPVASLPPGRP